MRILSIESSAKAASVAVTEDGALVSQYWQASGLTHSRTLLSMAEALLENLELKISDIDAIAIAKGPGSFTGVRIGVAAAKGLAWGASLPVCGVSTLEAMAYHLEDREGAIICPVMDARCNQVYNAKFIVIDGQITRLCEDRAITIQELIDEAKHDQKPYFLVGDGAVMCYNIFLKAGLAAFVPVKPLVLQSAWGVARAAEGKRFTPADDLAPNYLRLSQAERVRLEKLAGK